MIVIIVLKAEIVFVAFSNKLDDVFIIPNVIGIGDVGKGSNFSVVVIVLKIVITVSSLVKSFFICVF